MVEIVVLLYARDGEDLGRFESQAMPILREHGGEVVSAFVPRRLGQDDGPDEVHVLRFPNEAAFGAYGADPRLAGLSSLREQVIMRTEVYVSGKSREY